MAQYQRDESGCINGDCNLQAEILAIAYQQQKDTDSDGLSDYDEINIYKTSPYLEDTDGDGFTDKEEIDSGNDPNCPGSENCFNDPTVSSSSLIDIQSITSGNSTPQELRDLLLQKGFPAEALSSISDDDLMATYQQVLSGGDYVPPSSLANPNTDLSQTNINSIEDLHSLSGAQIRQLMIDSGAPEDLLSQVSDDQLKEMFLSQLESKTN